MQRGQPVRHGSHGRWAAPVPGLGHLLTPQNRSGEQPRAAQGTSPLFQGECRRHCKSTSPHASPVRILSDLERAVSPMAQICLQAAESDHCPATPGSLCELSAQDPKILSSNSRTTPRLHMTFLTGHCRWAAKMMETRCVWVSVPSSTACYGVRLAASLTAHLKTSLPKSAYIQENCNGIWPARWR